ncbi:MAG: glycosyltransferase family 4 protein [Helicobacter sp.]|nr:glycosyltransferase family 4 protein [Helicobacter sp.]MDE7196471.1 glycosyltransferase family 4 protein [Helicobacter sp.]
METKISVLHTEWSNGWGGQEIRIINEMLKMRELGCECALACRKESQILDKAQKQGFETFTLPFRGQRDIKTILALRKILRGRFDIINTHSGIDTWCGGLASLFLPVKFIRTRHLSNKINTSRLNFINELADYIFTTGTNVMEMMITENRIKRERIQSIPTGIDTSLFDPTIYDKTECRRQLGLPENALLIGNLGVLRRFKRQDVFISLASMVAEECFFVIAGAQTSEMRAFLDSVAREYDVENRIIFLGHVENPAVFLKAIDVFVMTSDCNEGVPQSLMQALAMELPCIASDIGSIKDLHTGDNRGENFLLLHAKPDREEYALALNRLIHDLKNEPQRLCLPNRAFIVRNFSLDIMGRKILDVYSKLLGMQEGT